MHSDLICCVVLCCRGTTGWTAPELYSQNLPAERQDTTTVTAKADVYATGWVFFEVLCGEGPLIFSQASNDDDFAHSKNLYIYLLFLL